MSFSVKLHTRVKACNLIRKGTSKINRRNFYQRSIFQHSCLKTSVVESFLKNCKNRLQSCNSNKRSFHQGAFHVNTRILLTTESRSTRGASRHPAFTDGSLTVSQTRLPCPPCGKMRLQKKPSRVIYIYIVLLYV